MKTHYSLLVELVWTSFVKRKGINLRKKKKLYFMVANTLFGSSSMCMHVC